MEASLDKAVSALGAVEVPGHPGKFAIKTPRATYLIATSAELAALDGIYPAFKRACWFDDRPEMKPWWSPQQQTVIRVTRGEGDLGDSWRVREDDYRRFGAPHGSKCQRVTCDLTTGEEVEV